MFSSQLTYVAGDTFVHRLDARVKIVVLLAVSIALVVAPSWPVLLALSAAVVAAAALARIPAASMVRMLAPVLVMAAFAVVFNVIASPTMEGLSLGAFFAIRMIALVAASFVVCLTSSPSDLLGAFAWFIGPLGRIGLPVDDVSFTLALSLRFIPAVEAEFAQIRAAQISRGAEIPRSPARIAQVWALAFSALFVNLFRHADSIAQAMEARCYGACARRTRLPK